MTNTNREYRNYGDYVQSANTLFHFMRRFDYLKTILTKRAVIPRYCVERMDYLNIRNGDSTFSDVAVLQKCFCDIPLHKLADTFSVTGTGQTFEDLNEEEKFQVEHNSTHFDLYGGFAIGFSKDWSEHNRLQPIHYLNTQSCYSCHFQNLLTNALGEDDLPDLFAEDVLYRLAFIKPLRGIMQRRFERKNGKTEMVDIRKNFHDECEWRFVPDPADMPKGLPGNVFADSKIIENATFMDFLNRSLEEDRNNSLWLHFSYDDIRYLIVPEASDRTELIDVILDIPDEMFITQDNIPRQKYVLISKILVLSEIRKDW